MPGIGGTVADIFDQMTVVNNEIDVTAGGADEGRALLACNAAQHWMEMEAAANPRVLGDILNVVTALNTESSTWTSSLRRLDALWYLDNNGNPIRKLKRITEIGGHVPSLPWPLQIALTSTFGGAPFGYYADMKHFYWLPKPDGVYSVRIYGFFKQAEFVARGDNFNYPIECKIPIAQFAARLLSVAVGDDSIEYDKLAAMMFKPLFRQLRKFDRSEPMSRFYNEFHTT